MDSASAGVRLTRERRRPPRQYPDRAATAVPVETSEHQREARQSDAIAPSPLIRGGSPNDLTTVQLVERLTDQVSTLVRTEIAQGLAEIRTKSTAWGSTSASRAAGALLLFLGVATLIATAVLALATVVAAWLAALIVALAVLIVGAILTVVGARRAKRDVPPLPQQTVDSVRTDVAVVKESVK